MYPSTLREIKGTYFKWLIRRIGFKSGWGELLQVLHRKEFVPLIPYDENRVADAVDLRSNFMSAEYEESYSGWDETASLLEVLVALADRMAYIMFDGVFNEEPNTPKAFWLLINNLGLDYHVSIKENLEKIDRFLHRDYFPNGAGGLFPLAHPKEDQRYVEIWYQMMAWINERMRL